MEWRTVVCDIDNTIADQFGTIQQLGDGTAEIPYDMANDPELVRSFPPIPHAVDTLKLIAKSYQVVWLTARRADLRQVTAEWLDSHDFPAAELIMVDFYRDKIEHLDRIRPALFIDDLKYDYYSRVPKAATQMVALLNSSGIPFASYEGDWRPILYKLGLVRP